MAFLKRIFIGLGVLGLIYAGGSGTQSSSLFMQGLGFFGLLVGLIILYIFGRMMWKGLGCMPSLFILLAIAGFMMYALGMFNNGISGVGDALSDFVGYKGSNTESMSAASMEEEQNYQEEPQRKVRASENFERDVKRSSATLGKVEKNNEDKASPNLFGGNPEPVSADEYKEEKEEPGFAENMVAKIVGKKAKQEPQAFNPNNYPVVYGSVRVISGDTLEMYGKIFQLFGIDAPEVNQTCANRQGRAYNCGREAAMWLKNWILDNELECHVIQQDTKGNMVGTCSYGPYDLGAALVNAGWAVSNPKYTDIYYPYEIQAQKNRAGLWQGTFYKPWDWRKLQSRKADIKVIKPKKKSKGMFD